MTISTMKFPPSPSTSPSTPSLPTPFIYRYKFRSHFICELEKFSMINYQYKDRKVFKKNWKIWLEENETMVYEEIRHHQEQGYPGKPEMILDKMFKSARYYFSKKALHQHQQEQPLNDQTSAPETKKTDDTTKNIGTTTQDQDQDQDPSSSSLFLNMPKIQRNLSKELLKSMDQHIQMNLDLSPSLGFLSYCKENQEMVMREISILLQKEKEKEKEKEYFSSDLVVVVVDQIREKMKKTFKNRYYKLTHRP